MAPPPQKSNTGKILLIIGGVVGVLVIGVVVLAVAFGGQARDALAKKTFSTIDVGDCLKVSDALIGSGKVPREVPCTDEHSDEVFFTFDLAEGGFPGLAQLPVVAKAQCQPQLPTYLHGSKASLTESTQLYVLGPNESQYGHGLRKVACTLREPGGTLRTSTYR